MDELFLQNLYKRIFESAVVAIGVTDKEGRFVIVNKAWSEYLGYTALEAKQINIRDITPEEDISESDENYKHLLSGEISAFRKIKQYKNKKNKVFWADLHVSAIKDDNGESIGVLGIFVNIDEKVKAEQRQYDMNCVLEALNEELLKANNEITVKNQKLQEAYEELDLLARRDVLTGLYNRRSMNDLLESELGRSRRSGRPFFVAIADIDDFKKVNDTYGHECGDEVLKVVARLFLEGGVRTTDYVGRWGGEEFLFILTETDYKGAKTVFERVRKAVANEEIIYKGQKIPVTVTIGFSYQKDHYNVKEMTAEADRALYEGKRSGKNKVLCFYC